MLGPGGFPTVLVGKEDVLQGDPTDFLQDVGWGKENVQGWPPCFVLFLLGLGEGG